MRIIDTHLHLIDLDRLHYPWLDGEPALKHSFTLAQYKAQAEPAGIEAMLHMEVDVAEADQQKETDWVTSLGDGVIGAIACCRPEHETFPAQIERLAANPKVRGLRRTFHFTPDALPQQPDFAANIRLLARYGLSYDLCCLPRQLPIITRLAAQAPDVQFVLDHCGVPNVRDRELDPWRADIEALSALPNVACKISGVIAYGHRTEWTVDDLRPFVEHAIDCFGWNRVVWGSDWPVCTLTADLAKWVAATHQLLEGTSEDEKIALLSRNATRIYRLAAEG
ncbi:amidohydrolase family protein [Labrys monachus]|uniref:TIM-barrel fold metal-dependent hydrolase n=1 Tax=Labrys monachus TaxID=217067 RepID=A0ABU0FJH6_9HYPH|nr:amidohydrolase [Labrys monachus]MDQ0394764.1 putative TIM-barrel fold metal-dependent hydrolase [Labrys monachus]